MNIYELFTTRTNKDIKEIATQVAKIEYLKAISDIEKEIKDFITECKKIDMNEKRNEYFSDILICVHDYKLDNGIKKDKNGNIDFDKLDVAYDVNGYHEKELIQSKRTKELPIAQNINYDRKNVIKCEIMPICFEKYSENLIAAEIFNELTFFGIENEIYDDEEEIEEDFTEDTTEAQNTGINVSSFDDTVKNFKTENEAYEDFKKITFYNIKRNEEFLNEYIDKYLKDVSIYQLFTTLIDKETEEVAKYLANKYKYEYKDKDEAKKIITDFIKEIKKFDNIEIDKENILFIEHKEENKYEDEWEDAYYIKRSEFEDAIKEILNGKKVRIEEYAFDTVPRAEALSYIIAGNLFEEHPFDALVGEIFYEMTFWGISNEKCEENQNDLIEDLKESMENLKNGVVGEKISVEIFYDDSEENIEKVIKEHTNHKNKTYINFYKYENDKEK